MSASLPSAPTPCTGKMDIPSLLNPVTTGDTSVAKGAKLLLCLAGGHGVNGPATATEPTYADVAGFHANHDVDGPATPLTYGERHRIKDARGAKNEWSQKRLRHMLDLRKQLGLNTCPELQKHLSRKMGCLKQALIMFLHIMRKYELITSQSDKVVKYTWTSFRVVPDKASVFRLQLLKLFDLTLEDVQSNSTKQRTINSSFTGIGYRPNDTPGKSGIWQKAYNGKLEFVPV
jgi:hypothetical protein